MALGFTRKVANLSFRFLRTLTVSVKFLDKIEDIENSRDRFCYLAFFGLKCLRLLRA